MLPMDCRFPIAIADDKVCSLPFPNSDPLLTWIKMLYGIQQFVFDGLCQAKLPLNNELHTRG